ncbi:uncharacterized protein LOC122252352 [Penaeus japonicus]|uniref:uncharacterized protein LOC122252352 n=1 Tax=Penaeus japonicus TaxID=27405 RepID=UPI001C70C31C|nr:uncharacterized protein LOC122252352 [Penaeus japonicus]
MLTEALLGILLLVLIFAFVNRRPENLPPGQWGLPVLGKLPSSEVHISEQVVELRKKFGNIISWRIGSRIFIFFCDYKTIKTAFAKMEFSDRTDFYSAGHFNKFTRTGLINTEGLLWQNNRRFTLRHLRDLGMGKTRLEEAIQHEAVCLVEDFARHTGRPGPLPWSINVAVLNVIWQMVADRRYKVDDEEMQEVNKLINLSFEDFQDNVIWFDFMPWLIPIVPHFVKKWIGIAHLPDYIEVISKLMKQLVKEHQATLDPENPRDYIDAYLLEMEARKDDPQSTMSIEDLLNCLSDLFVAGTETVSSTLRWAILYLAKYPEVQAKVQREIDSVVPRDVPPSVQQKNSMPYLEAVTLEIHRLASLVRIGVLHFCAKDTEFEGYTIPKRAVLSALQEGCHMDPAYWEKPYEFYPEHFLDDQGKVLTKKEGFLPFGLASVNVTYHNRWMDVSSAVALQTEEGVLLPSHHNVAFSARVGDLRPGVWGARVNPNGGQSWVAMMGGCRHAGQLLQRCESGTSKKYGTHQLPPDVTRWEKTSPVGSLEAEEGTGEHGVSDETDCLPHNFVLRQRSKVSALGHMVCNVLASHSELKLTRPRFQPRAICLTSAKHLTGDNQMSSEDREVWLKSAPSKCSNMAELLRLSTPTSISPQSLSIRSTMLIEALLGVLLVLLFAFVNRRPEKLPPGLWGLPIIGKLPSEEICLHDQIRALRKKFGNIVSWRMGSRIFIFFCDYKTIKAAFAKPEFADRPDLYSLTVFNRFTETGIIISSGLSWQNNRRFTLRHLRDLGMGKTRLEEAIQHEAVCLVEDFARHTGRPGPLPSSIGVAVLNVIWQMVAGRRYDVNDFEIQKLNQATNSSFEDFQAIKWFDFMPWIVPFVPHFLKKWTGALNVFDKLEVIHQHMAKHVREHQATLDPENPRDYIDAYLLEMEAQKDDPQSTMSIEDLSCCLVDLFNAGSETSSSAIRWALLYLAKYPEVQAKVHKEIDSVVPRDVLPSIQQRSSMPYLEAVILEVHRVVSFVRLGVYKMCSKETQFEGYTIPKGAILTPHPEGCHTDPAYWEKPYEFYPEHFLDDQGKVLTKKEGFMPFGLGRRQCLGESLARMEIFVFLSALLQHFSFSAPEGKELSVEKDPKLPLLNLLKPVETIITKRK